MPIEFDVSCTFTYPPPEQGPGKVDVSKILSAFLLMVLPLVLWAVSRIGRPPPLRRRDAAGFAPDTVPEPAPNWISFASWMKDIQKAYGAEIQADLASKRPTMCNDIDAMVVQMRLVDRTTYAIARIIETVDEYYIGFDIDYDHVNSVHLTLSSDHQTRVKVGELRASKFKDRELSYAICCDMIKRGSQNDPHIFVLRLSDCTIASSLISL
jgi:hypothetical protein